MNKLVTGILATLASVNVYAAVAPSAVVTPQDVTSATISAPVKEVVPAPKKFVVTYGLESWVDNHGANTKNYSTFQDIQFLALGYKLTEDRTITVRQNVLYNQTDKTTTNEVVIAEPIIQYSDDKAFSIGAKGEVASYLRLYMPGTEYEKEVGLYEVRFVNAAKQQLSSKAYMDYMLNFRGYAYSKDSTGQRTFRTLPTVDIAYDINKSVTPFFAVYTDNNWYNTGAGRAQDTPVKSFHKVNDDSFVTDIGSKFEIADKVSVLFFVETYKDMRSGNSSPFYNEKMSQYNLFLYTSL